jgi:hypothetical protein
VNTLHLVLGYLGPEVVLPLTSVFAAALGVLLVFWRFLWRLLMMPIRYFLGRKDPVVPPASGTEPNATPRPAEASAGLNLK